ncbi:hypothetical protein ACFU0W_08800 [Microbacterium keratanolyticum]|uniref:hypothetical protein n=1 Tax=Microbacterium keratanolyticum TaxID=67574 RepID=UPI003641C559
MSNPMVPPMPLPDGDDGIDATVTDEQGNERIDPDVNDDLIDSAEADRAAGGADEGEPRV